MNKRNKVIWTTIPLLLAVGVIFWRQSRPPSLAPAPQAGPMTAQATSAKPSTSPAAASAPAGRPPKAGATPGIVSPFAKLKVLEANAILAQILKQDLPAILQSWLDAARVEDDLTKQGAIASKLGGVMRARGASPEFLQQLKTFIEDPTNPPLERNMLIAALEDAATPATTEVLIAIATTAKDEVTRGAIGHLSLLGTNYGGTNQEELAPLLNRLWLETHDRDILLSVVPTLAQVGAPSSMELLLAAALAPAGQDDVRKKAAFNALRSASIRNNNAVPPLVARLSTTAPEGEASKLASETLARISLQSSAQALVTWLQASNPNAVRFALEYSTHTQFPEIWQAALNPAVPFRSEQNREAIRAGLAQFHAGRTSKF